MSDQERHDAYVAGAEAMRAEIVAVILSVPDILSSGGDEFDIATRSAFVTMANALAQLPLPTPNQEGRSPDAAE